MFDTNLIEISPNQKTIVIVDDQPIMRAAIKRILEKEAGVQLFEFSNGRDAIDFLKNSPADLIVTDLYMDKGSGFDLILYVRGRSMANDVPIVVVSGEATRDDIVYTIDVGASGYILKPFEPPEFLQKIQSAMERFRNPTPQEQKIRLAEGLFLQGKIADARSVFLALDSGGNAQKSPRVLTGIAQCELASGNLVDAEKLLIAAVKVNALYFPAYTILGDLYLKQNEREKAKAVLIKELSINGKQPLRRLLLAHLLVTDEGIEKAIEEVRKGLIDTPRNMELLLYAAELSATRNDEEKAAHYYLRTRKAHPDCTEALDGIANLYLRRGKPEKAHFIFKDLIKANPKAKDIYFARSRLYEQEKKLDDALADIEFFLTGQEENLEALKLKAKILNRRKDFESALTVYLSIVKTAPSAEIYSKIGITLTKLNKFKSAIQSYEKAVNLAPENPNNYYNMGFAYEALKMYPKAIDCYQRTRELDPSSSDASSAIERVRQLMKTA